ncbi:hypothetical protein MBGDC06_00519 [Thermoplasmatales archaeon SCGC AB-539-C06]|nr:hypothetical protein MBGDC06_00519 [Thermoplasmatales archaeon SCGC AB-539-C06]
MRIKSNTILILAVVVVLVLVGCGLTYFFWWSADPYLDWNKTFGGGDDDYGNYVCQIDDGYIIVGETSSYGAGSADVWLIKTDHDGNKLWSRTFGGSGYDWGKSAQQTSDGGYIVAGYTESYGVEVGDALLIKTDYAGNMIWNKTIGGLSSDAATFVQQTNDGGFVVSGYTYSYGAGGSDAG